LFNLVLRALFVASAKASQLTGRKKMGIDAAHFSPALRPPTPTQPPSSPRFPEHISSQPFDRGV
jgi:hypothetical protein